MSDPAVIAAETAYGRMGSEYTVWSAAVIAARVMAEPLRALHRPMTLGELADAGLDPTWRMCWQCSQGYCWEQFPCANAEHLYSAEELEQ